MTVAQTPFEALQIATNNEKAAPELLDYQHYAVEEGVRQIKEWVKSIHLHSLTTHAPSKSKSMMKLSD